jgi:hypothetical protein
MCLAHSRLLRGEVPLLVGVEEHFKRVHTLVNVFVVVQRAAGAAVDESIRAAAAAVHGLQCPCLRKVVQKVCMRGIMADVRNELGIYTMSVQASPLRCTKVDNICVCTSNV